MDAPLNPRAARTAADVRAKRSIGMKRRRAARLPRQIPPNGIARDYALELSRRVVAAVTLAFAPLLADLPSILESAARDRAHVDSARADAGEGRRVRAQIAAARAEMEAALNPDVIETLAGKFATRTATYQRIQLARQTQAALGADVFIGDHALQSLVEIFTSENVALVKGLTTEIAARVEKRVLSGVQGGMLHGDLATEIQADMGIGATRAKLIARDQVGKLYGQVNAARQREMGVTSFVWRTVRDARVRSEHVARDGQIYQYAEPPNGELPGEPILCRCYAEPDLAHLLAASEP